jgi:ankyrin repeat protein
MAMFSPLLRVLAFGSCVLCLAVAHATDDSRLRAVQSAIKQGQLGRVRSFLAAEPDLISRKDGTGGTLLHDAANGGQVHIVELLLKRGAKVDARDGNGRTPLFYAAFNPNESVSRVLIRHGANVNAVEVDGASPLTIAAGNGFARVAQLLVVNGAKVEHRDGRGATPLLGAAAAGSRETVSLLLKHGANLSSVDNYGQNALHHAAMSPHGFRVLWLLRAKGLKVDGRGGIANQTPLFFAAKKGRLAAARWLIAHGADVDATDTYRMTPLLEACQNGHREMAELLLSKGASLKAVNIHGRSAEALAEEYDFPKLAQFLRDRRRHR